MKSRVISHTFVFVSLSRIDVWIADCISYSNYRDTIACLCLRRQKSKMRSQKWREVGSAACNCEQAEIRKLSIKVRALRGSIPVSEFQRLKADTRQCATASRLREGGVVTRDS